MTLRYLISPEERRRTLKEKLEDCKKILNRTIDDMLGPYRERMSKIKSEDVKEILREGGKRARKKISETVTEVREKMGLLPLSQ